MKPFRVFVGYDPKQANAYHVCVRSMRNHASIPLDIVPLHLENLRERGLYTRQTEKRQTSKLRPLDVRGIGGREPADDTKLGLETIDQLWDVISNAPMATEFAISRFLVPVLADYSGVALFCDCDFLWRDDVAKLFDLMKGEIGNDFPAVRVVKHLSESGYEGTKMSGERQTAYAMKNWSSLVLWNCSHLKHAGQLERVARWPGLWLHQFRWLGSFRQAPVEIGEIRPTWNVLDGSSRAATMKDGEVAAYHYTLGCPDLPGYRDARFADEWRSYL